MERNELRIPKWGTFFCKNSLYRNEEWKKQLTPMTFPLGLQRINQFVVDGGKGVSPNKQKLYAGLVVCRIINFMKPKHLKLSCFFVCSTHRELLKNWNYSVECSENKINNIGKLRGKSFEKPLEICSGHQCRCSFQSPGYGCYNDVDLDSPTFAMEIR